MPIGQWTSFMNRLTDRERKALMDYMCSFDKHVPCAGIFRPDPADKGVDLWGDMVMDILGTLSMGGLNTTTAQMVQAHGHVPLYLTGMGCFRLNMEMQ